jgi:hypothetical protein
MNFAFTSCSDIPVDFMISVNIVSDLLKAFLGSGSVNTFQRATMGKS